MKSDFSRALANALFDGYGSEISRIFCIARPVLEAWADGTSEPTNPVQIKLLVDWMSRRPKHDDTLGVGRGWWAIVDEALDKLHALSVHVLQVKEKFGGLRIYVDKHREDVDSIIQEAARQAALTCDLCGRSGEKVTSSYWIATRCAECTKGE